MQRMFFMSPKYYIISLFIIGGFLARGQSQGESVAQKEIQEPHKLAFQIYPNPLQGKLLHLQTEEIGLKEISIYDVMGNLAVRLVTREEKIELNGLTTGIYILKLQLNGKVGIKRLVVR
jgi:hypothetical protein